MGAYNRDFTVFSCLKRLANEASGSMPCDTRQNDPVASFVRQNR